MKKKVLYITNIQVPYRVKFFNELSKECDLTVLYERSKSSNRNENWSKSCKDEYKKVFLDGIKIGNESSFSLRILKYIFGRYDVIIIGCHESRVQRFAILFMKIFRIRYIVNIDGETFMETKGIKNRIKLFLLRGADKYIVAGEKCAISLAKLIDINEDSIEPYYFSSMYDNEIKDANLTREKREGFVLVVGQYFPYKGLDIAAEIAKSLPDQEFKFIGMGNRAELLKKECGLDEYKNIKVIQFLQKKELEEEYKRCKCLLLPTRQECWGLVINEAAAFGTPIVSTFGSGAAIEFLKDEYLAIPNDSNDLKEKLIYLLSNDNEAYSQYLKNKSKNYSIEISVNRTLDVINNF